MRLLFWANDIILIMSTNAVFLCLVLLFTCLSHNNGIELEKGKQKKYRFRNEVSIAKPLPIFLIKETFQSDDVNVDPDETVFNDEYYLGRENYNYEEIDNFPFTEKSDFLEFIDEDKFLNNPMFSGFSDVEDDESSGLNIKTTTVSSEDTISPKNSHLAAESVRSVPLIKSSVSDEKEESVLVTPHKNLIQEHDNIVPLQNSNAQNSSDDFYSFVLLEDKNEQQGNSTIQIAILNSSILESPTIPIHRNLNSRMETVHQMFLKIANPSSHSDEFTSTTTGNNIITKKKYSVFRKNTSPSNEAEASTSAIFVKSKDVFFTDQIEKANLNSSFKVEDSFYQNKVTKMKRSHQPQNDTSNQNETDLKRGIKNITPQNGTGILSDNDLKRGIKNRTHTGNQNDNDLKRGIKNRTSQNGTSNQNYPDLKRVIENTTIVSENYFIGKGVPPIVKVNGTTNCCGRSNLVWDMLFIICSFIFIFQ